MFTIVYDVTIGFLFGIPVSVFWWMFLKTEKNQPGEIRAAFMSRFAQSFKV